MESVFSRMGAKILEHRPRFLPWFMFSRKSKVHFEDPLRLLPWMVTRLYSAWVRLIYPFESVGRNVEIHYRFDLRRIEAHLVRLGDSVLIDEGTWIQIARDLSQSGEPAVIIESGCELGRGCHIHAKNRVHIERDVMISNSVLIMDCNHAYEDLSLPIARQGYTEGGTIRIGQGSWIGEGAAIVCSKGELVLGRNCVVAANAVVSRSFPPHSIIIGNPAAIIRRFDPEQNAWVIGAPRSKLGPDTTRLA